MFESSAGTACPGVVTFHLSGFGLFRALCVRTHYHLEAVLGWLYHCCTNKYHNHFCISLLTPPSPSSVAEPVKTASNVLHNRDPHALKVFIEAHHNRFRVGLSLNARVMVTGRSEANERRVGRETAQSMNESAKWNVEEADRLHLFNLTNLGIS